MLGAPPPTRTPELLAIEEHELQDLQDQAEDRSQDPLAQAMLAQSQALTSLVSQLAAASGSRLWRTSPRLRRYWVCRRQRCLAEGKAAGGAQVLANLARSFVRGTHCPATGKGSGDGHPVGTMP